MKLEMFVKILFGGFIAFLMLCATFFAPIACAVSSLTYPEAFVYSLYASIAVGFVFALQYLIQK